MHEIGERCFFYTSIQNVPELPYYLLIIEVHLEMKILIPKCLDYSFSIGKI